MIIAQHSRVPETDRCELTFGSFGVEFDSSRTVLSGFQATGVSEDSKTESAARFVFKLCVDFLTKFGNVEQSTSICRGKLRQVKSKGPN